MVVYMQKESSCDAMGDARAAEPLTMNGTKPQGVQLKRRLGLFSAVNVILAVMIGSGIFVSPSSALFYSGSVGMSIIVWSSCGILSLLGALVYAELSTVVQRSGSEYAYFMEAFACLHPFWGRLPAFLYSYVMIFIIRPAEVAIIILTFSEYLCQPVLDLLCVQVPEDSVRVKKFVALVALGSITYINVTSVRLYVKITNIFSAFKVMACLVVICGGIYELCKGNTENLAKGFEGTKLAPENFALAFFSGLWAYDGWSAVTVVTEEVKKPEVNILRSIIIGVPLVTIFYVMMNISYMTVLSVPEMTSVPAVAVAFGEKALGPVQYSIPFGVALSTFGCALSVQFGVTRLCYAAAQDGLLVNCLSFIHIRRLTPSPAVVLQGVITFIFLIIGGITSLIEFVSFLIWIFYGLAMVSLLTLRRTKPNVPRPYRVPTPIAYLVLVIAIYLSATPLILAPSPKYLAGVGFILAGIVIYYAIIYRRYQLPVTGKVTKFIQFLFEVVPPERRIANGDMGKNIKDTHD